MSIAHATNQKTAVVIRRHHETISRLLKSAEASDIDSTVRPWVTMYGEQAVRPEEHAASADLQLVLGAMRDVLELVECNQDTGRTSVPLSRIRTILSDIPREQRASELISASADLLSAPPLWLDLHAEALEEDDRPQDAASFLKNALAVHSAARLPKTWAYGLLYERLGCLLATLGDHEGGISALRNALHFHPFLRDAACFLANLIRSEDPFLASALLLQATRMPVIADQHQLDCNETIYFVDKGCYGRSLFMCRGYFFARLYPSILPLSKAVSKAIRTFHGHATLWPTGLIADLELPSLRQRIARLFPRRSES